MLRIVVNADDFGLDNSTNQGIVHCFKNSIISNTTIIPNMGTSSLNAIQLSKDNDFFDKVGLHLNLMEGIPMTEKIRYEELFCNNDGIFDGIKMNSIKKASPSSFLNKGQREALAEEVETQIRWYLDNGFTEKHMDSHQSVHSWNIILDTILPLFYQYGFHTMRRRIDRGGNALIRTYEHIINKRIHNNTIFLGDVYKPEDMSKLDNNNYYEFMVHPKMQQNLCIDSVTGTDLNSVEYNDNIELVSYANL